MKNILFCHHHHHRQHQQQVVLKFPFFLVFKNYSVPDQVHMIGIKHKHFLKPPTLPLWLAIKRETY